MRWLLALPLLLLASTSSHASLESDGTWAAGTWNTTVWADGVWLENEDLTAVPEVRGQASAAAADTILEGVGLDLGTETARCSSATSGQVVDQNPTAGTLVAAATLVNVSTSNGTPCKGKPPLWLYLETTR